MGGREQHADFSLAWLPSLKPAAPKGGAASTAESASRASGRDRLIGNEGIATLLIIGTDNGLRSPLRSSKLGNTSRCYTNESIRLLSLLMSFVLLP